ncbi:hypothetical protein WOSG25_150170 [Weissella oryzae SG25]|uniref:Uncharacterized protein n=1 Tax=Weissella oryzae (strain DSM 25784 / JCM 18191 / LMG 30913 / SG25) TaxID=1329250 RepID=A0A069D316_WEIOS|nr:hypothetical protein [Weissella oryzae]GAK31766.1 hypothetical protein WOSG25_150170 [Weissella oryzae SG25]
MPRLLKVIIIGFALIVIGIIMMVLSEHFGSIRGFNWNNHGFAIENVRVLSAILKF